MSDYDGAALLLAVYAVVDGHAFFGLGILVVEAAFYLWDRSR